MEAATEVDASAEKPSVSYYKPPQRRPAQLNARVTQDIKSGLADLARAWTVKNKARYGEDAPDVSEADVVNMLLENALEGAWIELGMQPATPEQWTELEALIRRTVVRLK